MAIDAGAHVERGVWAAGVNYEKGKFNIGAIDYYSQDIINIAYAQGGFEVPLATDWRLRFAGQYIDQGSLGDNELQGHSFSGHQFGIKVELPIKKALFTAAFTHEWGNCQHAEPVERLSRLYQCSGSRLRPGRRERVSYPGRL